MSGTAVRGLIYKNAKWVKPSEPSATPAQAYRRVLKACRTAMWGDDAARGEMASVAKSHFAFPLDSPTRSAAGLSTGTLEGALKEADEAVEFMMTSIVQGKIDVETGRVAVKVEPRVVSNKKDMKLAHGGEAAGGTDDGCHANNSKT